MNDGIETYGPDIISYILEPFLKKHEISRCTLLLHKELSLKDKRFT